MKGQADTVLKIGLAVIDGTKLMIVRKRGLHQFILPGGKPDPKEDDLNTLVREVREELDCSIDEGSVRFLGEFTDRIAGPVPSTVTVKLYKGRLVGTPEASAEIEEINWVDLTQPLQIAIAPSLRNQIVPFLSSHITLMVGVNPP